MDKALMDYIYDNGIYDVRMFCSNEYAARDHFYHYHKTTFILNIEKALSFTNKS